VTAAGQLATLPAAAAQEPLGGRGVLALYASFFFSGIATVILGPLLPELRARWGLSPEQAALLFLAQFLSTAVGAVLSPRDLRRSPIAGYAFVAAGFAMLAVAAWPFALGALALVGFGLGLVMPATNLLVAYGHPERRAAALNQLNFVWCFGAVSSPLLFVVVPQRTAALGVLAVATALASLSLLRWLASPVESVTPEPAALPLPSPRRSILVLLTAQIFLYTGTEAAIGGWIVDVFGRRDLVSLLVGSGFWASLLCGRAAAPFALRRVTENALQSLGLALAGTGALALLLSESRGLTALGAGLAGLGLAPLFPLLVSALAHQEGARSRATGIVFAFAGLGPAALPSLSGRVAGVSGLLRGVFLVPLVAIGLMALLGAVGRALARRRLVSRA
jgi:FHS family glucose/mannose:H+ symporter-like MFS transporter